MKLHLPKLLLAAVLAVVATQTTVQASEWNDETGEMVYYINETEIDTFDATVKDDLTVYLNADVANNSLETTISTAKIKEGQLLYIDTHALDEADGTRNFKLLTIANLQIVNGEEAGAGSLRVGNKQTVSLGSVSGTLTSVSVDGTLALTNHETFTKIDAASVNKGGMLDLTSITCTDANENTTVAANHNMLQLMNKLTGDGTVKLASITQIQPNGNSKNVDVNLRTNYVVGEDGDTSANLRLTGWARGSSQWRTWLVTNDGSITVGGGAGTLDVRAAQKLEIQDGGEVTAGSIVLGHEAEDNPGCVTMSGSNAKLTVGTIKGNAAKDSGGFNNQVNITGGSLTVTSNQALGVTGTTNAILYAHIGGTGDDTVKLLTADTDWTMDGSELGGGTLTVGNITVDAANENMITIANATLNGVINNAGKLTLSDVTVTNAVEVGGSGSLVIADTITNSGTLDLTDSNISLGDSLAAYKVKKDGSVTYSIDTEKQNGFMIQDGAQLFLVQGGGATVAEEDAQASMGDTAYGLTSDETGIWFTSGNYTSSSFYISDGDVEVIGSGAENATGAKKYILQGGTMQLTGGTIKTSELEYTSGGVNLAGETGSLKIDNSADALRYLTSTTGTTGTIDLATSAVIDNGGATVFEGALKISSGGVLKLGSSSESGNTLNWSVDVSSLKYIDLAGGELKFRGGSVNLGDIKVTEASTLHLYDAQKYDVGAQDNSLVTIDSLDLGANLTLSTTWKSNASIGLVTGSNASAVMTVGDCSDNKRLLTANIAHDFAGKINVNGGDAVISNLYFKAEDDTSDVVALTGLKATGNGNDNNYLKVSYSETEKTVTVERKRNADGDATVIDSVALTNGSTLKLHGESNQIVTTINKLSVTGSATVLANWNEGDVAITGLTGTDATLNLKSTTPTSRNTLFNLNDSETYASNFSGVINVSTATNDGARRTVFNLNSADAAKNAVISLENTSTDGTGDTVALAIGADRVTVAGLKDGANNNSSKGTMMIVSGTQGIGGNAIASDSTARTLVLNTTGISYTTSAKVSENINLEKSGAGKQTFSGDMSAFNGTVKVSGGSLEFSKADGNTTVSSLTLDGGALDVTGTLTLSNVTVDLSKYTAGTNIELVTAGTLRADALSVSYANGATTVGNYTGTLAQDGNSLWLNWKDATPSVSSITTSVSTEEGWYTLSTDGTTLTLTVTDSLAGLATDGSVMVDLLTDAQLSAIMGNANYDNPYVLLELTDGTNTISADAFNKVVFVKGDTGQNYWGEMVDFGGEVGTKLAYNVERIPEPASATLSLAALMMLCARRRRQK